MEQREVNGDYLLMMIGKLYVENSLINTQLAEQQQRINELNKKQLEKIEELK